MPHVTVESRGSVAVLKLDRPPANAIDLAMADALCAAVEAVDRAAPSALVVVGRERFFCAGVDLRAVPTYDADQQRRMVAGIDRLIDQLYAFDRPLVGAINGHAMGGGLIVALCCDWRVGTDDPKAQFGLPEVRVGVPYPDAPMRVVRTELSRAAARRLALGARSIGASEALALDVFDELAPPDRVLERAVAVAQDLGSMPREAYRRTKRTLRGLDPGGDGWLVPEVGVAAAAALRRT